MCYVRGNTIKYLRVPEVVRETVCICGFRRCTNCANCLVQVLDKVQEEQVLREEKRVLSAPGGRGGGRGRGEFEGRGRGGRGEGRGRGREGAGRGGGGRDGGGRGRGRGPEKLPEWA